MEELKKKTIYRVLKYESYDDQRLNNILDRSIGGKYHKLTGEAIRESISETYRGEINPLEALEEKRDEFLKLVEKFLVEWIEKEILKRGL